MTDRLFDYDAPQPAVKIYQFKGERTALRLEAPFLRMISRIATETGLKAGEWMIRAKHHYEALYGHQKGRNFASYIRSLCMAHAEHSLMAGDALSHTVNLRNFMDLCPLPALLLTDSQDIMHANPAFFQWINQRPALFRGRKFIDVFHIRENQSLRALIERMKFSKETAIAPHEQVAVTYRGGAMGLAASAIFVPYADKNDVRYAFLVWLQTSANQRPARIIKPIMPSRPDSLPK